jgi:proline dehydrogenase
MSLLNRAIAGTLPLLPKAVVRPFARPYIAGETVEQLVREIETLNREGFMVAISQLGEFVTGRAEAEEATAVYRQVLDEVHARRLSAYVHVKVTQLGLMIDRDFCRDQIRQLLAHAAANGGTFMRMDMEDSPRIDATLGLHRELHPDFPNFGVVLQARMRRSLADARELARIGANVRVCKGVYLEPPDIAYTEPQEIRDHYVAILRVLLSAGCYAGIATHDDWLISEAEGIIEELGLSPDRYEFQMLHGVRPRLRAEVKRSGHRVRVGVPFGPDWMPYSLRRLRKNPEIARHVLRAVFSRG